MSSQSRYQRLLDSSDDPSANANAPSAESDAQPNRWTWILTSVAGVSGLLFGYDTGIISSTLLYLTPGISPVELTAFQKALITSATSFGALLGGLSFGLLADKYGRRTTIWVADVLFVVGALSQAYAHTISSMVWGRWVVGLGVGIGSGIVPMYISELAPPAYRGRLVTISILFITFGQLISYILGIWSGTTAWRVLVGIGALPAMVQALALLWMPESPRWLVQAGRTGDARDVLSRVYDSSEQGEVEVIVEQIENAVKKESKYSVTEKGRLLFKTEVGRRQLGVACLGQGLQQLCGFNSLMYFSPTIFAMVHFDNPTATASLIALTNMLTTMLAFTLIDRIGRRRILLLSLPGMSIGLILASIFISRLPISVSSSPSAPGDDSGNSMFAVLTIGALLVYVFSYALGIGNVPWHQSELFPLETRAMGSSISTACNWTGNLVVGLTFLPMMVWAGVGITFVGYAVICALGWLACWRWFPEMKGVSMEDVETVV